MFGQILAGIVLVVCVALLLRMALGVRRREALDRRLLATAREMRARWLQLWQWRRLRRQAREEAEAVIRRAREGHWDGNVYRSDAFRRPRKPH